ncbi:MAG: hypothetical protein HRJ53_07450 [Acidobacteria bacterium Pan2503]|uniref:Uncharacterized protein n=1 Tax=Candidatus Acidiferrum panamense TaxID=2741543 RepID=A0A7V8NP01_9BACT|nr:hypothetical protein [Candidatus Acidoferrum panamensis]
MFSQLVDTAATPADGFDDDVAAASAILDQLDGALGELSGQTGGTLDDAFADILTVDPADAGTDVANLQAAIPDVSSNVDQLGVILGGAPPVGPVPGGGGTRPATCGSLDMGAHPFLIAGNANFVPITVTLTNNFTYALTVKGVTWTPAQTYGFQVSPPIDGAVIQPGASLPITILAGAGGVGTTQATLTVQTDGPDPQPCLNVTAEWIAGTGPSPIGTCVKCSNWGCP